MSLQFVLNAILKKKKSYKDYMFRLFSDDLHYVSPANKSPPFPDRFAPNLEGKSFCISLVPIDEGDF